jgi:hypothetical protein
MHEKEVWELNLPGPQAWSRGGGNVAMLLREAKVSAIQRKGLLIGKLHQMGMGKTPKLYAASGRSSNRAYFVDRRSVIARAESNETPPAAPLGLPHFPSAWLGCLGANW